MLTRQFDTTGRTTAQPAFAQRIPVSETATSVLANHVPLPDIDVVPGALSPQAQAVVLSRSSGGRWDRAGHALLQLQRLHGNHYVQQVLGHTPQPTNQATAPVIQTALVLGPANDRYEREADRVAQQLMEGEAGLASRTHHHEDGAKEMRDVPQIQRLHRAEGGAVDPEVQQSIGSARGGGRPLVSSTRHWMEQRFDADFSGVRIHTDARADQLTHLLAARAFTTGQDVFLRRGEPHSDSRAGRTLIAHELTHVLQQRGKAPHPAQDRGPATPSPGSAVVQRLISADKFKADTTFWFSTGKSDQIFLEIVAGLRAYENSKNVDELLKVYETATGWLYSEGARSSSRAEHVKSLVEELEGLTDIASQMRDVAKRQIAKSTLPLPYQQRACKLIDNPDEIDQTAFGVCGMVSILRPVLTYAPVKFAGLIIEALTDPSLDQTKWKQVFANNALPAQVHAELDFLVAQWLVRHGAKGDVSQKVLVRKGHNVGELDKTKQYSRVFATQKAYSESFKIAGWEDVRGHFATTTGGLNYLAMSVVRASSSYKIKITDFAADYNLAKTRAGVRGQVIASVTDTSFYKKSGAAVDTPATPHPEGVKFRHWVIIDSVSPVGDYFDMNIWTWAKNFKASVHKDVVGTYFYSFVAVTA